MENKKIKKILETICENNKNVFGNFFYHILSNYCNEFILMLDTIKSDCKFKFNSIELFENLLPKLVDDLRRLFLKILIIDIHSTKEENLLMGDTPEEKYNFYNESLLDIQTINEIFKNYPVLKEIINNTLQYRMNLVKECLINLNKDSGKIKTVFNIEVKSLKKIEISSGDSHNFGKKVIILSFENEMLVYKPHPLSSEELFNKVSTLLNNKNILKQKISFSKCIDCESYGWQEYIKYKECTNNNEVKEYYYRVGSLLSMFHLFSTTDIHYDNLVVRGNEPIVFDLETLVYNTGINKNIDNNDRLLTSVINEYENSVMSSMLLPTNNMFESMGVDVGGISTKKGYIKSRTIKGNKIINPGTSNIRMKTIKSYIYNEGKNIVRLKNKKISPINYIDEIIEGFSDCYKLIIKTKTEILDLIKKDIFIFRQVLRSTNIYCKFLEASTYYSYLKNSEERYKLFSKFKKSIENEINENIVNAEIESLMRNDVPYFSAKSNSKSLFYDDREIKNVYNYTLNDQIENTINKLDDVDLDKQINYIRMSIYTLLKINSKSHNKRQNDFSDTDNTLEIVKKIASQISKMLIWNKKKTSCTMMYTSVADGRVTLSDGKLYYTGGTILLFAYLGWYLNDEKYINIAKSLVNGLKELKHSEKNTDNFSFFIGLGSYIYIYYTMFALFKEQSYYDEMFSLICKIKEPESAEYDTVFGTAATIIMLLNIYNNIKDSVILDKANLLGESLYKNMASIKNATKPGLAHGFLGTAWCLIYLGNIVNNKKFIALGKDLFKKEVIVSDRNNKISPYWCVGETGILLSKLKIDLILDIFQPNSFKETIDYLLSYKFNNDTNHSLCHGILGVLDGLIELNKYINNTNLDKYIKVEKERIINDITNKGVILGGEVPHNDFSFMLGLSGIGYSLLRIILPQIPSVLSFDVIDINSKSKEFCI